MSLFGVWPPIAVPSGGGSVLGWAEIDSAGAIVAQSSENILQSSARPGVGQYTLTMVPGTVLLAVGVSIEGSLASDLTLRGDVTGPEAATVSGVQNTFPVNTSFVVAFYG